ncbi:serine/threonine-protein kinase [Eubacterium sp.]|uniref:serine/threonine-protein kinase n=1 Tax=Eubacterium sp. TaxID=142586 RepID=UPI001DBBB00A|nr:serine/threonine-protein kinase [Eubacterium sp.]MBS5619106.1 serine/threonine protein kinase [Eubacterium sp.]
MNFTMEYYLLKYEELSVLSDTKKCRTSLMRNKDTGEIVVKKEMGKESFSVYSLLKSIKNKNLIKVLECFRDEDKTIEIEEYVNGKRLDDYFREKKATLEQVVDVGIALCEGLAPMHKLNLVHRDIQPKNIIITNEGSLKIIDFDISRKENENATHDTTLLGTVGYAAPEQYGFAQTTNRSDIYSIGAVLKELSSFSELDKIIAKCMEMDPANRYENVEQLENELEKVKGQAERKNNDFGSSSYNHMEFGTETNRTAKTIKIGNYTIRINNGVIQKIDSLKKNNVVAQKIDNIRKNMENKATLNNSNSESDELPKITLKYFIKTIPGFRRGNFIFMIIAIMMYGMILCAPYSVFIEYKYNTQLQRVIGGIFYMLGCIIPYMYFANIGDIARRLPPRQFNSRLSRILYQIGVGLLIMIVFWGIATTVLPPTN